MPDKAGVIQPFFDWISPDGAEKFVSLAAAAATGVGAACAYSKPRRTISMQVSYPAGPSAVKVELQVSIDKVNWFTVATFDTGASGASGDIVSSTSHAFLAARANLVTLTGGGEVTATIVGTALGS